MTARAPKPSDSEREAQGQPPREERPRRDKPAPAEIGRTSAVHKTPNPRVGGSAKNTGKTPPD
jgi:hypothetical protein